MSFAYSWTLRSPRWSRCRKIPYLVRDLLLAHRHCSEDTILDAVLSLLWQNGRGALWGLYYNGTLSIFKDPHAHALIPSLDLHPSKYYCFGHEVSNWNSGMTQPSIDSCLAGLQAQEGAVLATYHANTLQRLKKYLRNEEMIWKIAN